MTLSEPNFLRRSCQTDWGPLTRASWPDGPVHLSVCLASSTPWASLCRCAARHNGWMDRQRRPSPLLWTHTHETFLINLWLLISWWVLGLIWTARFFSIFFCFKYSFHKACPFSSHEGVFGPALTFDPLLLKPSRSYLPFFFSLSVIRRISYFSGSFTTLQHYQMAPSQEAANQETQTLLPLIDSLTLSYRFHSASLIKIGQNPPPPFFQQKVTVLLCSISCMWKSSQLGDKTGNFTVSAGHLKRELWGLTLIQKMVLSAHPILSNKFLCFWWQNICQMN